MSWLVRAQLNRPLFSTTSGQSTSNTFYFAGSFGTTAVPGIVDEAVPNGVDATIAANMVTAYNALAGLMSANIVAGSRLLMYDMLDAEPRVPIYDEAFGASTGSGTALPSEVAVCLSYRSNAPSGAERRRYRGRVYLGPLNTTASSGGSGATPARPAAAFSTALATFCDALSDDNGSDPNVVWSLWSPTDQQYRFIQWAGYDDAFDTQRSRGVAPSATATVFE